MTVTDFAEYRLRMRAGGPSAVGRSYYLTGLTQGVRRGALSLDRDLRERLTTVIRHRHPTALVHDPVAAWFGAGQPLDGPAGLAEFRRLIGLAATSDVCVALLPDPHSVVDVVAELQAAHRGGATVVVVTEETDDFLVHAYASVLLPDLDAFVAWAEQVEEAEDQARGA